MAVLSLLMRRRQTAANDVGLSYSQGKTISSRHVQELHLYNAGSKFNFRPLYRTSENVSEVGDFFEICQTPFKWMHQRVCVQLQSRAHWRHAQSALVSPNT